MRDFTTLAEATRTGGRRWRISAAVLLAWTVSAGCSPAKPGHAIKARVSGLVASETALVLQLNGGHDTEVTADGEVTLAYIVEGVHYHVGVKTQPQNPAHTCTVGHATGVVGSADVTDVTVDCSVNGYRVTGVVRGLRGSNLGLQLDVDEQRVEELSLDGNAAAGDVAVAFETRVASLSSFTVTVTQQPTDPGQFCSASGSGVMGSADVTNVVVTCSTSGHKVGGLVRGLRAGNKVTLQDNGAHDLDVTGDAAFEEVPFALPEVAEGGEYAVAVKTQPATPVQFCAVTNGLGTMGETEITNVIVTCRGWGTAQLIEASDASEPFNPWVAMDPAGNAIAVWQQSAGTRHDIWANRFVAGAGWGTAQLIETDDAGAAYCPQVAMDPAGHAIAVWAQADGSRYNIWSNRYTMGYGWGAAQLVETSNESVDVCPQVAMDQAGNAIAVWKQWDGTHFNIWANRFEGTAWGTARLIEADDHNADLPRVAMDPAGNAIVVWTQWDGARYNIWASRFATDAGWGTARLLEIITEGYSSCPAVAMDPAGNAIAVWDQWDGTRYNIWASRFADGGWEAALPIESDDAADFESDEMCPDAGGPQVAMDPAGNATVAWSRYDGTHHDIVITNRYAAGTGWGAAQPIEADQVAEARGPRVAMDGAGNAIAVWEQSDATRVNIRARRYVAGLGWDTPELVETDNSGGAYAPHLAMDPAGDGVAVWRQWDGTRYNIWANRFY